MWCACMGNSRYKGIESTAKQAIAEIAPSLYSKNGNIALLRSGKQVLQLLRIDYDISVR